MKSAGAGMVVVGVVVTVVVSVSVSVSVTVFVVVKKAVPFFHQSVSSDPYRQRIVYYSHQWM